MNRLIAIPFSLLISCLALNAQPFRPYHSFGIQANANINYLFTDRPIEGQQYSGVYAGYLNDASLRVDVLGNYDWGITSWFGLNSGLGLSMRGGANNGRSRSRNQRRDIYYLNIPIKLQLKPFDFLWIEPGIENKLFLWYSDQGYPETDPYEFKPFDAEQIDAYDLTAIIDLRFNLFKGLSLNLGHHFGLKNTAEVTLHEFYNLPPYEATYRDYGFHIGVRYMFNEPE